MKKRRAEIEFDTGGELDDFHPARQLFSADVRKDARKGTRSGGSKAAPPKGRSPSKIAGVEKLKAKASARVGGGVIASLSKGDRKVIEYLDELKRKNRRKLPEGGDCVASIPEIAEACDLSPRQVQNCTHRLIQAGLLRRIAYDFSNPDLDARGTIFKVLL